MKRGKLIILEGIDGSGTTTQAGRLTRKFKEAGLPVHLTAQPSKGPFGLLIRDILQKKIDVFKKSVPSWQTMSLMFAADRKDQQDREIEPLLKSGKNVICDRYLYSSVIYQSTGSDYPEAEKWIMKINKFIIEPDIVFFLSLSAEKSAKRRAARGDAKEIFDAFEFQQKLVKGYLKLKELFPETKIISLNADLSPDEICSAIWSSLKQHKLLEQNYE
jgi:dTMP kinase